MIQNNDGPAKGVNSSGFIYNSLAVPKGFQAMISLTENSSKGRYHFIVYPTEMKENYCVEIRLSCQVKSNDDVEQEVIDVLAFQRNHKYSISTNYFYLTIDTSKSTIYINSLDNCDYYNTDNTILCATVNVSSQYELKLLSINR